MKQAKKRSPVKRIKHKVYEDVYFLALDTYWLVLNEICKDIKQRLVESAKQKENK